MHGMNNHKISVKSLEVMTIYLLCTICHGFYSNQFQDNKLSSVWTVKLGTLGPNSEHRNSLRDV
jgi:hypothetical protein